MKENYTERSKNNHLEYGMLHKEWKQAIHKDLEDQFCYLLQWYWDSLSYGT